MALNLVICCFLYNVSCANTQDNPWLKFVNEPSEKSYMLCREEIDAAFKASKPDTYHKLDENLFLNMAVRNKLSPLVAEGNVLAIELVLYSYPFIKKYADMVESY